MNNFLVKTTKEGKIKEIIWSDPVYLVSRGITDISELFDAGYGGEFREKFKEFVQSREFGKAGQPSGALKNIYGSGISEGLSDILMPDTHVMREAAGGARMKLAVVGYEDELLVLAFEEGYLLKKDMHSEKSGQTDEAAKEKISDNDGETGIGFSGNFKNILNKFMRKIGELLKKNAFTNSESTSLQFENIQTLNNQLINTRRQLEKANIKLQEYNKVLNNRLVKDSLTGLVSRYQYRTEMELKISEAEKKYGIFAFIDMDDFKSVNDNYGHAAGDEYLIEFSKRLQDLPYENIVEIRIAGDEFGLFFYDLTEEETRPEFMEKLWKDMKKTATERPIKVADVKLPVSISVGFAVYGKDTEEVFDLIDYADFAMYIAKDNGKNDMHIFDIKEYNRMKGLVKETGS